MGTYLHCIGSTSRDHFLCGIKKQIHGAWKTKLGRRQKKTNRKTEEESGLSLQDMVCYLRRLVSGDIKENIVFRYKQEDKKEREREK